MTPPNSATQPKPNGPPISNPLPTQGSSKAAPTSQTPGKDSLSIPPVEIDVRGWPESFEYGGTHDGGKPSPDYFYPRLFGPLWGNDNISFSSPNEDFQYPGKREEAGGPLLYSLDVYSETWESLSRDRIKRRIDQNENEIAVEEDPFWLHPCEFDEEGRPFTDYRTFAPRYPFFVLDISAKGIEIYFSRDSYLRDHPELRKYYARPGELTLP